MARQLNLSAPMPRVAGRETLLSIDHARDLIGYRPEHSWHDAS